MLENMLISHEPISSLKKPLSGLALHFGEGGLPCEAAWLAVAGTGSQDIEPPKVRVYVSKSSLNSMRRVYEPLGDYVTVKPLKFNV
jgi:hypothetical protein